MNKPTNRWQRFSPDVRAIAYRLPHQAIDMIQAALDGVLPTGAIFPYHDSTRTVAHQLIDEIEWENSSATTAQGIARARELVGSMV